MTKGKENEQDTYIQHLPVKEKRLFLPDTSYSDIDWNDFNVAVDAFGKRIEEWYIKPIEELNKGEHFGFAVMAMNCILIDALSQFYSGAEEADRTVPLW
jgi:hypothetical protein